MGDILFLAHRVPFPPDRGDKIRSHHLLKTLAKLAPVHVGCFAETEGDFAQESAIAGMAASHCLAPRGRSLAAAGLAALTSRKPVSLAAFDSPSLRAWVASTLQAHPVDTIFVFSGQMGQYVPDDFRGRVVIDLCDVDSAKFEAYAAAGRSPRRWIDRREAALLAAEESRLAARADCTLLITDEEAALFRSRGNAGARIATLGNGIDTAFFDPQHVGACAELSKTAGPHIVFTGQMDYPPNIAAAQRMAHAILPRIRAELPHVMFHIVGRAPAPEVRRLASQAVRVWGEVPDVRPYLAAADLVAAPLTIARGVQNKVLEAMAMERAVVLSPEAATGIAAADGTDFAIAADDVAFARTASALLSDRPHALAMGAAARRFVVERQGWDAMLAPLPGVVGRGFEPAARSAA